MIPTVLRRAASLVAQSTPDADTEQAKEATEGFDSSQLLPAGIILAVAVVIGYALRHVIERAFRSRNEILARLAGRAVFALFLAVGLVYALAQLGIRVGLLLGALGIGGFAIAFALRDTLENLISGIILQVRQPFDYDDTVEIGDYAGSVDDINLRSVEMTTFSGEKVIIPSSTVLQNPIENWTANPKRRLDVDVGVAYDVDVESVCELLQADLVGLDDVLETPAPDVVFAGFGASSIDLTARVWYASDGPYFDIQRRVAATVKRTLEREGIDIPYPTRSVLRSDSAVPDTESGAGSHDASGGRSGADPQRSPGSTSAATHADGEEARQDSDDDGSEHGDGVRVDAE